MAARSSPRRLLGPSHATEGEAGPNLNTSAEDEGVALNPVSGSGSQMERNGIHHSNVWRSSQTAGMIGKNFVSRQRIHLGMDIG